MKLHELKIKAKYFWEVALGKKTAELRYNDRDYKVGDILCLKEIEDIEGKIVYTGHYVLVQITHILTSKDYVGLAENNAMLSFAPLIQATNNVHDCSYYKAERDNLEKLEEEIDRKESKDYGRRDLR